MRGKQIMAKTLKAPECKLTALLTSMASSSTATSPLWKNACRRDTRVSTACLKDTPRKGKD